MAPAPRQPDPPSKSVLPVRIFDGHKDSIPSIAFFPDGKRMISGSCDRTARRWDLHVGKEIKGARYVCEQDVLAVTVSKDGRWVVTAGGDDSGGELKARDVETGITRTFEGHSAWITCIDISADSTLLASGSYDFTARIWSLDTGKLVAGPFKSNDEVRAVRFSPDSKKLAVMSSLGRCIEVWDVHAQKLDVRVLGKGNGTPYAPVFWTTEDRTIVAAFSFTDDDSSSVYEFAGSTLLDAIIVGAPFKGHTGIINGLALSSDCALLASASNDNTIKLWAFESRQLLASFSAQKPRCLILSPTSCQLAYTTWGDKKIYIGDIPPAQQLHRTSAPRRTAGQTWKGGGSIQSWTDIRGGSSHVQPADMRHPLRFQPLPLPRLDLRRSDEESTPNLPGTPRLPVIALPLPPPRPSPTMGSQLLNEVPHPHKLVTSSSHTEVVLPIRNDEREDSPPEAMLQNLTRYITKDEDYPVARGGFGEIWKCTYHMDLQPIKVAVKSLQVYAADQLGPAKKKKIQRMQRELRICASLKHANILPVYGYTSGFGPFIAIVSPWAENGNLTAYLEREGATLTLIRRFQILRDIIAGLHYLHVNSIIHGDFNGPNVLIHGDGTACIADFGLSLMYSKVISASQASWTSTLKGNMRWMAPELLVEREDGSPPRPSEHSDIYSFGGIMLQTLTNKIPYHHLSNDAAIILCIAKSEKPSRARYPVLPDKYWDIIEQCWSTDPEDRPSTERVDCIIGDEFYSLNLGLHQQNHVLSPLI